MNTSHSHHWLKMELPSTSPSVLNCNTQWRSNDSRGSHCHSDHGRSTGQDSFFAIHWHRTMKEKCRRRNLSIAVSRRTKRKRSGNDEATCLRSFDNWRWTKKWTGSMKKSWGTRVIASLMIHSSFFLRTSTIKWSRRRIFIRDDRSTGEEEWRVSAFNVLIFLLTIIRMMIVVEKWLIKNGRRELRRWKDLRKSNS